MDDSITKKWKKGLNNAELNDRDTTINSKGYSLQDYSGTA